MITHDIKTTQGQYNWRQRHPMLWCVILGLLITGTTIIALLCALFIFLNTQLGKDYVLTQIQKRTHDQVQIQGISSFFSSQLSIANIKFKDPKGGVWLDAKQVNLNWSPWESFRNSKIIIYSLIAKEVNLYSFPSKRAIIDLSKDKQKSVNLAYVVDIQNIQIKRLFISNNIAPLEMYVTINGKVLVRDLSKMIDTETLKTVLMTKPKLHLLDSKKLPDFQFNGKVSGNLTGKEGSSASIPLHFSVMLPQGSAKNSNDKAEIYLDLGGDN